MINFPPALTLTHRSVIASCIACLLLWPGIALTQGELGTLEPDSGNAFQPQLPSSPATQLPTTQQPVPQDPASQDPANEGLIVITPGAPQATAVTEAATVGGVGVEGVVGEAGGTTETGEVTGAGEAELDLETRMAAWRAELAQLDFRQVVRRIRNDEREINKLYINMPMTIPAQQLLYQRRIEAMKAEVVELRKLLEPAALKAFRSDPTESKAATEKVFEVLSSKLLPKGRESKFDPVGGLRLVNTILEIKGGDIGMKPGVAPLPEDGPFAEIIFRGYLASYWLQDFKGAEEFLTRLENMDIGLDPQLRENFEATVQAWKEEQAIQAKEAEADDLPRVKLETTNGDVVIELFENEAPNTVANFIKLTKSGYYDNLEFFHVVPGKYVRSGCTANDGTTNPGYRIRNEFENGRRHFTGTVAMQNDGENTAGSQFIIFERPDPNLEGQVVAFGRVIEGMDNIYEFETVNRIRKFAGAATVIKKATVLRDRGHEYEPEIIEDSASLLRQKAAEIAPEGSSKRPSIGMPTAGVPSFRRPVTGGTSAGSSTTGGSSSTTGGSNSRPPTTEGSSTKGSSSNGSSNR